MCAGVLRTTLREGSTLYLPSHLPCSWGWAPPSAVRLHLLPMVDTGPLELAMGCQAYLSHTLRTPKLVDELVQRVHGQLPAQCAHLGQQALFQPFYPVQDTRPLLVSLKWVQGPWRGREERQCQ